jgi:hypothetical protein
VSQSSNRNDRFWTQLEAYVLGALEPEEAARLEEHLPSCPECRERLKELEQAVEALPSALSALGPLAPPELRAQVLAAIANEPAAQPAAPAAPGHEMVLVSKGKDPAEPGQRPRGRLLTSTTIMRLAAAAVLLLALAWSVRLTVALEQERAIKEEFATLVSQQEIVLEVVDSDKTVRRVLRTTDPGGCEPGSCPYGKLFTRTDLHHVVAMAARLSSPPAGESYRLWVTAHGLTEPAGTLTLDDKGFGLLVFDAERAGEIYERAELILQRGESRTPDGDVVLRWTPSSE